MGTPCNWLNHFTCAASARCVATGQLFLALRLTVPIKNSVDDDIVAHFNAFLIVAVPLPSTQQRDPSPRIVRHSCTSPLRPKASNTQLESALSRLSLLAHITLLHPHLYNHPLCNSLLPFQV